MRTVEEGLKKFTLTVGVGDQEKEACAMTLLSWVRNRGLTDHPPCVHRLIADLVIAANDSTTATNRKKLVEAHESILDTWFVPDIVIAWAQRDTDKLSPYARAKLVLRRVKAWQAKRQLVSVEEACLRGANLRGANLRGANLRGANLRGANLREANLREANLREADLWKADLWKADLWKANLREADLREADLWKADLWKACLWKADLREADLREARLQGACLRGAKDVPLPTGWTLNQNGIAVKI